MEMIKVEILSRDIVKPSSPTPTHLRDYKLCLLDQFYAEFHCAIVFFYSAPPETVININNINYDSFISSLKNSSSDTLTDFYPIAGRFKDTTTIDCNDNRVCVVEAKINSKLSDFLVEISKSSDVLHQNMAKLVPSSDSATMELASECIVIVELTVFECRGFTLTFCQQYRYGYLSSAVVLLKNWSARASGCCRSASSFSSAEIPVPDFVGSSFLPPQDLPPLPKVDNTIPIANRTTARLLFEASKISDLKSRFIDEGIGANYGIRISRVDVVLALILKSAISAVRSMTSPKPKKKSAIFQSINLRNRTAPPLPENSIGNLFWMLPLIIEHDQEDNDDIEFGELVSKMKRETTSFLEEKVRRIKGDEEGNEIVFEAMKERGEIFKGEDDVDIYYCSSWCRFPVYDIEFGWRKPVWVSSGTVSSFWKMPSVGVAYKPGLRWILKL